jgi:hypothetical protein
VRVVGGAAAPRNRGGRGGSWQRDDGRSNCGMKTHEEDEATGGHYHAISRAIGGPFTIYGRDGWNYFI